MGVYKVISKFKLFVFFIFCVFKTFAQSESDTIKQLDRIIISATKKPTRQIELPYSVISLDQLEISKQLSRTVPESLIGSAGIFIQKTNHGGGSPFVRGLTGNQTLILMDGIRINNSIFRYGPNQYLTLIEPAMIENIEVVKGTGSVPYGSDAMTGVIHLRSPTLRFSKLRNVTESTLVRWTSDKMEWVYRPELKYESNKFSFYIGGGQKDFGDLKGGDTTGFQKPSAYGESSIDFKSILDIGNHWVLTTAFQFLKQRDVPVYHKYILENFEVNKSNSLFRSFSYIKFNKSIKESTFKNLSITLSNQNIQDQRMLRKNGSQILRNENDKVNTFGITFDLYQELSKKVSFNHGLELYSDFIKSFRNEQNLTSNTIKNLRGLFPNGSSYSNISMYSIAHVRWKRLIIEGGLRYGKYYSTIQDTSIGVAHINPSAVVFQGGLNYRISKSIHFYSNINEGFRAPNIDDLGTLGIVDFRYEKPQFSLKPEKSLNIEMGLKFQNNYIELQASAYRTILRNLITRIKTTEKIAGYDVYVKENVDRGYINGTEISIGVTPFKKLHFQASGTYLYGQSITRNEPIRRIPPLYIRLHVEYYFAKLRLGIMYDHADPQRRLAQGDIDDNRIPKGGTPGFNLLNFVAGLDYKQIKWNIYVNNLLNIDYRMHGSGINGMGRSISTMIRVTLK